MEYIIYCEIMILKFRVRQVTFMCIILQVSQNQDQWKTYNTLFIIHLVVCHENYNVIHCGKYEKVLVNTCLLLIYLYPDEVY